MLGGVCHDPPVFDHNMTNLSLSYKYLFSNFLFHKMGNRPDILEERTTQAPLLISEVLPVTRPQDTTFAFQERSRYKKDATPCREYQKELL